MGNHEQSVKIKLSFGEGPALIKAALCMHMPANVRVHSLPQTAGVYPGQEEPAWRHGNDSAICAAYSRIGLIADNPDIGPASNETSL
jgi:hypothetical protein